MKYSSSLFLLFLLLISIGMGTLLYGEMPWKEVWMDAQSRLKGISSNWNPLLDERLPRLIVLLCTGASLAVSGAIMQSLFHNPLASPSVLGISTGGCLFTVFIFISGWHLLHPYALPAAAFLGCCFALLLVYTLSRLLGQQLIYLILTGIAISTLFMAIQSLLLYALRDQWQLIQTITEWEAGTTTDRNWQHVHMQLPLTLVGLWGSFVYRSEMNVLSLGEEEALNLGVDVPRVRWRLFLCVALLTGGALAAVGMIAFFGLILPHIMRALNGPNHRQLIPLCALGGAAALAALDLFLRVFTLYSFSIGNLSAIIGGCFFLLLLFRTPWRMREAASC